MPVFPMRLFGDPVLRRPARAMDRVDDSVRKLVRDLFDTMIDANGAGLAAPQIGVGRRVIVWQHEEETGMLANPEIVESEGTQEGEEGCLSIPGLYYPVVRAEWARIRGLDESSSQITFEVSGFKARILQHEIDHLDGVLFIDRLTPELQKEAKRTLREQALSAAPVRAGAPAL